MTEEQKQQLALIDDMWGSCVRVEADAARIKTQLVALKKALGLDTPSPKA